MERELFESYVTEAIAMVPLAIRKKIENVAWLIEDQPTPTNNLLGLYRGIPLTKRNQGYSGVVPDTITIYQVAIETQAGPDPANIRKLTHEVVHHEIGHYFGFSEAKVRQWERQRRKK